MQYTIADIAKIVGVSKSTVSRVINNKNEGVSQQTKERIMKTIEEVGYRPNGLARSITNKQSKMIGIIVPDLTNPFFPQLISGIDQYLSEKGYTIFLCNADNDVEKEKKHIFSLIDRRVDGIITATGNNPATGIKELKQYQIPIVCIDRVGSREWSDASVCVNNISGARQAVSYFINNGKTSIGFLGGNPEIITTKERLDGYKLSLLEGNYNVRDELILYGDFSIQSGYYLTNKLLAQEPLVDAIFAASDVSAIGAIKALKHIGKRVPEDIEVIGFDGIELGDIFTPKLSTIYQPTYEMAMEGARMLVNIIEGEMGGMRHIIVEPTLVLKDTTEK